MKVSKKCGVGSCVFYDPHSPSKCGVFADRAGCPLSMSKRAKTAKKSK